MKRRKIRSAVAAMVMLSTLTRDQFVTVRVSVSVSVHLGVSIPGSAPAPDTRISARIPKKVNEQPKRRAAAPRRAVEASPGPLIGR
jgi:hypothetical protein